MNSRMHSATVLRGVSSEDVPLEFSSWGLWSLSIFASDRHIACTVQVCNASLQPYVIYTHSYARTHKRLDGFLIYKTLLKLAQQFYSSKRNPVNKKKLWRIFWCNVHGTKFNSISKTRALTFVQMNMEYWVQWRQRLRRRVQQGLAKDAQQHSHDGWEDVSHIEDLRCTRSCVAGVRCVRRQRVLREGGARREERTKWR